MSSSSASQPIYVTLFPFLTLCKQQLFKAAGAHGLTPSQVFLLFLTPLDGPGRTMHSFCSVLGCDASNITGIVDGLEKKELLARAEHPSDRRVKILRLLPKGKAVRQTIAEELSALDGFLLSKLTAEEVLQFTRLLQKITCAGSTEQTETQPKN